MVGPQNESVRNEEPDPARPLPAAWLRETNDITQQFLAIGGRTDIISLAGGLPAAELYPVEEIRRAAARALDRWGGAALEYGPVEGLPALRAALAKRIAAEAGANLTAENVLVTVGAMQGLDLLGKALLDPGDLVVAQFPTYLGALDAWRPRSPRYERLDWSGRRNDAVAVLNGAKFAYTVPNYSNPTGVLVPTDARERLLGQAIAAGTWLVEDDPYLPLQLDGPAGPSILALDAARRRGRPYDGPVVYLGTLSKSVAPGLRVGWVVAEAGLIARLALAKQSTDLSGSLFNHAVALELIESGADVAHQPAIVAAYRARRDALCAAAAEHLAEWFAWETPPGGMFVWMEAKDKRIDTDALYRFALAEGVAFVPSSVFDPAGALRSAMRVNFSRNQPEALQDGVRRLARAVRAYLASLK